MMLCLQGWNSMSVEAGWMLLLLAVVVGGGLRSMMWTLAPLEWRICAVAWPMPEAPPGFETAVRRRAVRSWGVSYRL